MANGLTQRGWRLLILLAVAAALCVAFVIAIRHYPSGVPDTMLAGFAGAAGAVLMAVWLILAILTGEEKPADHEVVPHWDMPPPGED